jgi:hypothetical protein
MLRRPGPSDVRPQRMTAGTGSMRGNRYVGNCPAAEQPPQSAPPYSSGNRRTSIAATQARQTSTVPRRSLKRASASLRTRLLPGRRAALRPSRSRLLIPCSPTTGPTCWGTTITAEVIKASHQGLPHKNCGGRLTAKKFLLPKRRKGRLTAKHDSKFDCQTNERFDRVLAPKIADWRQNRCREAFISAQRCSLSDAMSFATATATAMASCRLLGRCNPAARRPLCAFLARPSPMC